MAKLYEKIILQHYKQPLNRGKLAKPTRKFEGANYFCGDELAFYVKLDKQGKIIDVSWQGGGCAIAQASASIFSEMIKGKSLAQVKKMTKDDIFKKLKIKLSPIRAKCALLPLYIIKEEQDKFELN